MSVTSPYKNIKEKWPRTSVGAPREERNLHGDLGWGVEVGSWLFPFRLGRARCCLEMLIFVLWAAAL